MALTPVEIFQQPTGVIGQIVGGNNTIANALQNIFQVGRDLANNQVRQERDFLSETSRLEALDQRRAEEAQQQANLDRSYDRSVLTSDRVFAADTAERAIDNKRADAAAIFSRDDSDRRFGIVEDEQEAREAERERIAAERAKAENFNKRVAAPKSLSERFTDIFKSDAEKAAEAKARGEAAKAIGDADVYMEATGDYAEAASNVGILKPPTRADIRSERRLEIAEDNAAKAKVADEEKRALAIEARREKKARELIVDTEAFAPQMGSVEFNTDADGKVQTDSPKDMAKYVEAQNADKNKFEFERAVATKVSKQEYVNKGAATDKDGKIIEGSLSDAAKKRRAQFWDLVNGGAPAASPAAPAAPSGAQSDLDALLEGL